MAAASQAPAALGEFALGEAAQPIDAPDSTATGKEHFEVLDGLRGTAAILVVLFHIQGMAVLWQGPKVLLAHAPLAVDFFFILSGFVIGYAYDDRWGKMTIGGFFKLRLIRLHPLVILGVLLGLASYMFDPYAGTAQDVPVRQLLTAFVMGLLLLPTSPLPNRFNYTHPLNAASWSLFWEYVANVAYAFVLRRLPSRSLGVLALLSGLVLLLCAIRFNSMDQTSVWDSFWVGRPIRLCFSFSTGLWLYRVRDRLPSWRLGWLPLSAILIAVVALPVLPVAASLNLNGLYEAACIIVLFPLVVVAGSHSEPGRGMIQICKVSGRISYPLYITHFPFLYVWLNFVANEHPRPQLIWLMGMALVPLLLLMAWAAYRLWDVPIRRWLGASLRTRRSVI